MVYFNFSACELLAGQMACRSRLNKLSILSGGCCAAKMPFRRPPMLLSSCVQRPITLECAVPCTLACAQLTAKLSRFSLLMLLHRFCQTWRQSFIIRFDSTASIRSAINAGKQTFAICCSMGPFASLHGAATTASHCAATHRLGMLNA